MMKLAYSPTSPYVRKATASLIELGLAERVERVAKDLRAGADADYRAINPLGKIPALILEDGSVLFDSPVVCAYLQSLAAGADKQTVLLPSEQPRALQAQLWQAAADGILDACVLRFYETMRAEGERSSAWIARQEASVQATCAWFERQPFEEHGFSLGTLTLAIALDYVALRYSAYDWRTHHPKLAAWQKTFSQRPCLRETMPPTS